MKIFISSKEYLDDFIDLELKYTRCIHYSSDCEFYCLEAMSKKLPASIIELKKKEMTDSKKLLNEYQNRIVKMRKMNFIQRLLYKRGK